MTDTDDYHGHVLARKRRAGRCKEVLSPFISSAVPGMLQISPQVNILCQLYYYPYHNHYYNLYLHDYYYLPAVPGMLQILRQVDIFFQLYHYLCYNHYYHHYHHDCYYLLRCPWNVANITAS